jgi:hypothetical protein
MQGETECPCEQNYEIFKYDFVKCRLNNFKKEFNALPQNVLVVTKQQGAKVVTARFAFPLKKETSSPSDILFAYFTPSSNEYYYIYMLSPANVAVDNFNRYAYIGNHFTMGRKVNTGKFDLHHTKYTDYANPYHTWYTIIEGKDTYEAVVDKVCAVDCDDAKCFFFQDLMNTIFVGKCGNNKECNDKNSERSGNFVAQSRTVNF